MHAHVHTCPHVWHMWLSSWWMATAIILVTYLQQSGHTVSITRLFKRASGSAESSLVMETCRRLLKFFCRPLKVLLIGRKALENFWANENPADLMWYNTAEAWSKVVLLPVSFERSLMCTACGLWALANNQVVGKHLRSHNYNSLCILEILFVTYIRVYGIQEL